MTKELKKMDRKEIIREYKETPRPMGAYAIRNNATGRVLVGGSMNLPASFNGQRFQLRMGSHRSPELQADWDRYGGEAFAFEVLERVDTAKVPAEERRAAVAALEEKWLAALQPYGEKGYNARRKEKAKNEGTA
jgi:hypothetical protein